MSERQAIIPAAEALIGAVTERPGRILRVVVLDDRKTERRSNRDWQGCDLTFGACFSDWMAGGYDMTPEFVFSELAVAYGFADSGVMEAAIAEFGKIAECAWARAMMPTERQPKVSWKAVAP